MIAMLVGLAMMLPALVLPSLPFCALQLALLRYSKNRAVRAAPAAASAFGIVVGCLGAVESYEWSALPWIFLLFGSLLCLTGSVLGLLLWKISGGHFR